MLNIWGIFHGLEAFSIILFFFTAVFEADSREARDHCHVFMTVFLVHVSHPVLMLMLKFYI